MTITFVGAGAAVSGNNSATLSPPLHASTQAGDLVLILTSIRNVAAFPSGVSGWSLVGGTENVRVYGKIAAAGEPTPVVAFSGGVAGDDNIAQCATWRGVEPTVAGIAFNIQTNSTAVNLAYPALTVPANNYAVIVAGWRQDDTTGIATIAGYTEIDETNVTAGNDAAQVWDYQIQTTAVNLSAGSFTVTGLTAISKGLTLLIRPAAAIAVATQASYPTRTLVSVTGLTLGDDVSVYRQVAGQRTLLRGGTGVDVLDPSFLVVDAELPFGVAVSYVAVVNSFAEYATGPTTYSLAGGKVALSDAVGGLAAETVILSWPERAYDTNSSVYRAGARNIVVSGPLGQFTSTIDLFVETTSAVDNVRTVLASATSNTVQIRQAGGYDGVDSYVAVLKAAERRWSQDGSDQRRVITVDVVEVSGWAPTLEARGFTLGDIATYYGPTGTLADITADGRFSTLLGLAQADFTP
jgi:hypothetical protein